MIRRSMIALNFCHLRRSTVVLIQQSLVLDRQKVIAGPERAFPFEGMFEFYFGTVEMAGLVMNWFQDLISRSGLAFENVLHSSRSPRFDRIPPKHLKPRDTSGQLIYKCTVLTLEVSQITHEV